MNMVAEKRYAIYGVKKGEKTYISDDGDLWQAKCSAREIVGGLGRSVKGVRYIQTEVWDRQANDGAGKPIFRVWVGPLGSVYTTDSVGVKAEPQEPATASIKATGTYVSRAAELVKAFGKTLCETLGAEIRCERRGEDAKNPTYWWELPNNVQVEVAKSSSSDPRIWVFRSDPIFEPPNDKDWKNEWFERDYDDKLYHVGRIAAYAKEQVEYNRKKLEEHSANQKALGEELVGTSAPKGMSIERDPKTGFYEVFASISLKELSAAETKTVAEAFQKLKEVVAPMEPKKVSDEE